MLLGYKGENVPVLGVFSDVSENESEEDESFHILDPSDPRAHVKKTGNLTTPSTKSTPSTPAILSDVSDEDEDLSCLKEEETPTKPAIDIKEQLKSKLSKWALARFLTPRQEAPALVELPIEPLNDYILSDFGTRFRGDIKIEKENAEEQEEEEEEIIIPDVGPPLFSSRTDDKDDDEDIGELIDAGEEDSIKNEDNKTPGRKRRENRYFVTDLARKCFNCGQVGHVSNVCMNDKVLRTCYYCGLRGHVAMACPYTPCFACYQLGHEARNCTNRRVIASSCDICGRPGHRTLQCEAPEKGLKEISCMVCLKLGHQHCVPIPSPSDRRVFCPNCAEGHRLSDCPYISHGGRNVRSARCYMCDETGHIAADCPRQGVFCYACGEEGHFSRDCTNKRRNGGGSSGNGGGNNHGFGSIGNNGRGKKSRKRARDYYESEESDYLSPYQGRGIGNSSNKRTVNSTGRTVHLNAALPSSRTYDNHNHQNRSSIGNERYHQGSLNRRK